MMIPLIMLIPNGDPSNVVMRLAALFSGGKDSTYAAWLAEEMGHSVTCLLSMRSVNPDSYMFHTVNINLSHLIADAMGKTHVYSLTEGVKEEELEDLMDAVRRLGVEGLVSGVIASRFQKEKVDEVAKRLGIGHVSPLWGRERSGYLRELVEGGLDVIFTALAARGLDRMWLGRRLDENAIGDLEALNERYGVDICGEGGEYESLVLDAPWFRARLEVLETQEYWDGVSGRLHVRRARLIPKVA